MIRNLICFPAIFLLFYQTTTAQQPKLVLPIGHTYNVWSAEFSPDGKKIVTASGDNTAKIWDAVSGTLLADLRGHTEKVNFARYSPDGRKVLTASADHTAKIWDAVSGILIVDLLGHRGNINSAIYSPDGKSIVTASSDSTANIWDATTGQIIAVLKDHRSAVNFARFSSDGKKIVTASSDNTARIWDAATGKFLIELNGHSKAVNIAEFSPDGKKLVTASDDNTAGIWDAGKGTLIYKLEGHNKRIRFCQFSPDGKKLVTSSDDNTAKVWDVGSGKLLGDISGHHNIVFTAVFSPVTPEDPLGGKQILTCSADSTAKIWDAVSGRLIADLKGHAGWVNSAVFSPDGKKTLTASNDNTSKEWEASSGNLITNLKGHTGIVWSIEFSEDNKRIITTDFTSSKIWDAATGRYLGDMGFAMMSPMHFSPDRKKIVLATPKNSAIISESATGKMIVELKGHTKFVTSAQFSPDGKTIVTASGDSTAKIWDASTGELITTLTGHKSYVYSAQFSPDGKKIVTASEDGTAKIWDAGTGKLLKDLTGHTSSIFNAYFSPDGKKIVTGSTDYTAKLWNADSGKLIAVLKGHTHWVRTVQFSPDGKYIVSASADNTFKRWDATNGKLLYTFFVVDSKDYLVVDSSNHYDGTEAARKWLYFTCGTEVIELDQLKDQLWVPDLAARILKGDSINAKNLDELNICGLTPEVEDKSSKNSEYFFRIFPRRGGLGETILSVNGNPTKIYKADQLKRSSGFYDLLIRKEELDPYFITGKENLLTVRAFTSDNSVSSRTVKFTETSYQKGGSAPNLFAVMVGISDYKGEELDLKYAAKDATDISDAVAAAAKKLLNTDGHDHVFMYNLTTAAIHYQLPEKKSIQKILEDIGRKAKANDILLIFFAGHGVMEDEGKQFYFLTADASRATALNAIADVGISTMELTEWMKPQNIKAQKRILIFDACNSGQAIREFIKIGKDDQGYSAARGDDETEQTKAIDKLNEKSGLFILSASASNQRAYEMGRYSQGVLTYALLKAIKQQPDILEDGKYLNVSRWFNAAEKTVSDVSIETGDRQQPQIVSNTNFNIGIVDDDVISKISLANEKPLFAASNFLNGDENIADDDLQLGKMVNTQLAGVSSVGSGKLIYASSTNSADAFILTGRYDLNGNDIMMKVNIKQGKQVRHKFELKGNKNNIKDLAVRIVDEATTWSLENMTQSKSP